MLLPVMFVSAAAAVPFVVMSKQHSGTSFLRDVLTRHPEVVMWTEIFLPLFPKATGCGVDGTDFDRIDMAWGLQEWRSVATSNATNCMCRQTPSDRCKARQTTTTSAVALKDLLRRQKAVGFTWMEGQMPDWARDDERPRIVDFLRRRGARVVVLQRDNFVARAIASSGLHKKQATAKAINFHAAKAANDDLAARVARLWSALLDAGVPAISLTYEQLARNYSVFEDIFHFLHLGPATFDPTTSTLHPTPTRPRRHDDEGRRRQRDSQPAAWAITLTDASKSHKHGPAAYITNYDAVRNEAAALSSSSAWEGTAAGGGLSTTKDFLCMLEDTCDLRPIAHTLS